MTTQRLQVDVDKRLPGFRLQVRLSAEPGVLVLFGPSGAGKTLLMDLIAGLVYPDRGEISFRGEAWFKRDPDGARAGRVNLPARHRGVGYVFQHYALFPHLTVLDNVAFARWPARQRRREAHDLLERMHIERLAGRYPHEISGGQRQRVAIARALASRPRLLLLDEPFSALDEAVRERLQQEVLALQRELGLFVILVTHNIQDVIAMGERLAVLRGGALVHEGPVTSSLHETLGLARGPIAPIPNLVRAAVREAAPEGLTLDWAGFPLRAPLQHATVGQEVDVYVRPESVKLLYPDRPLTHPVRHNVIQAQVKTVQREGAGWCVWLSLDNGADLMARHGPHAYESLNVQPGQQLQVAIWRPGVIVLQREGEAVTVAMESYRERNP
jgi:molybdate transport system ATP-binding protein